MFVRMDDEVFRALADAGRRTLLDRLFERDGQTLGELETALPHMTRFGVMKHLRVLEGAGLVTSRKVGRERHHYLNPVPIRRIHDRWLDRYRERAADALLDLAAVLEDRQLATDTETPNPTAAGTTPPSHVFSVFIRADQAVVWRALTESEYTVRYYYASTIESDFRPGSPYLYKVGDEPAIEGEILESDPPNRLAMTFHAVWDDDVRRDPATRVTWELEASGPGVTRLSVVHDGLANAPATAEQVAGGWPFILSGLKTLIETGQPLMPAAEEHVPA